MDLRPPATNFGRKPKPTKQKYPFSAPKLTKDANSFIRTDGQTDIHSDKQTIESVHPYTTMSPLHPYMGFGTWKWWALNHVLGITIISIGPLSTHWPFPHLPVRNDKSEPKVANRTLELTMKVVMLTIYSTRTWKSFQIKCPSFLRLVPSTHPSINRDWKWFDAAAFLGRLYFMATRTTMQTGNYWVIHLLAELLLGDGEALQKLSTIIIICFQSVIFCFQFVIYREINCRHQSAIINIDLSL